MTNEPTKRRIRMSATARTALSAPRQGPPGCFVYALVVETAQGAAAYVGHTISLLERLRAHRKGRADGKGSLALFELAASEGRPVRLVILEEMADCGRSMAPYKAREATWYFRLADAGWTLSNAEPQGGFKRPVDFGAHRIDLGSILAKAEDLDAWLARTEEAVEQGRIPG